MEWQMGASRELWIALTLAVCFGLELHFRQPGSCVLQLLFCEAERVDA